MGGTSGIGKSIVNRLQKVCDKVVGVGRKDIDTTSLESVRDFAKKNLGLLGMAKARCTPPAGPPPTR